jgi:hypothetical protein
MDQHPIPRSISLLGVPTVGSKHYQSDQSRSAASGAQCVSIAGRPTVVKHFLIFTCYRAPRRSIKAKLGRKTQRPRKIAALAEKIRAVLGGMLPQRAPIVVAIWGSGENFCG